MKRLLPFAVAALLSVSALAFAQTPAANGLPTPTSLPSPALAPDPAPALDPLVVPPPAPARPAAKHEAAPEALNAASRAAITGKAPAIPAPPAAAEKYSNIPMAGRLGFMLGGRVNPAMSDYGVLGALKYWVGEAFAVKPAFNFNHHAYDPGFNGKSYGFSNVFLFSPWIGKTTRFNVGVGLGFDYSKGLANGEGGTPTRNNGLFGGLYNRSESYNSDEESNYEPRSQYKFFMPVEAAIEYHIRPWLSWEIGLNLDLFDYLYVPSKKTEYAHYKPIKQFGFNLDSSRFYTGITMYTN